VQVRGLPTHDRPGYLGSASIRIVAPAPAGFTVIDGRFLPDGPGATGGPPSEQNV
jgi:hypothetical protein